MAEPARATAPERRLPSIYPRLAYQDEVAALDFLTRAFGLRERRGWSFHESLDDVRRRRKAG
jgi:hypothetical protein